MKGGNCHDCESSAGCDHRRPTWKAIRRFITLTSISILSCFNIKAAIPAGIVGAAAAMSLPFNPIAAGAATVAVGVIAALRDKRKVAQETMKNSPMTYLYRMEQDLAPKEMWDWVRHRALGFGLGA